MLRLAADGGKRALGGRNRQPKLDCDLAHSVSRNEVINLNLRDP